MWLDAARAVIYAICFVVIVQLFFEDCGKILEQITK